MRRDKTDDRRIGMPGAVVVCMLALIPLTGAVAQERTVRGVDLAKLAEIDRLVEAAIASQKQGSHIPGAVVLVGRGKEVIFRKAYGKRALEPSVEEMTIDSIFDMASLTKPIATATAVRILVDRGKLRLDEQLKSVLPALARHGKGEISIEQLLRHRSGLIPDNPISDYQHGTEAAWERIAELKLEAKPGEKFIYSDVNYIILGRIVAERAGGLDTFCAQSIFEPLGMKDAGFLPATDLASRIVPTERDADGMMLRGTVHDPRARALGGVAGHAGLFGTADDLGKYCQMMLRGGEGANGKRILSEATVLRMRDPGNCPANEKRGLGWDIDTPYSAPRGNRFGKNGVGHTGFTGTSVWIDFDTNTYVILLTSRLHPDGSAGSPNGLRRSIAGIVAEAIEKEPAL